MTPEQKAIEAIRALLNNQVDNKDIAKINKAAIKHAKSMEMHQISKEFWKLSEEDNKLKAKRLIAIKKWDVETIAQLDELIKENHLKSDLLIEKMKILSI